jgi:RimJ/RimL family protein N-acetyltransferase
LNKAELTDGVIFLRPHTPEDAADHLAGEDDDMAKWLNGGHSTPATVETFIQKSQESWRTGGPRRPFGIFDCTSQQLIGFVEANLASLAVPGQVNLSYGVFQKWRGKGIALRAIDLIEGYLQCATEARQIVLRIPPENVASLRVAEKGGFTLVGVFDEPAGRFVRYVRDIQS